MIGLLVFAGVNAIANQISLSQLKTVPLVLDVRVARQSFGTSCGEAVIAMVLNYAFPESPISEAQIIEYASANGYFTEGVPPYTSPANMVTIARYYARHVDSGTVINAGQGLSLVMQRLGRGEPVIIDVLSNFSNPESEAHFIVAQASRWMRKGKMRLSFNPTILSPGHANQTTGLGKTVCGMRGKPMATRVARAGGW